MKRTGGVRVEEREEKVTVRRETETDGRVRGGGWARQRLRVQQKHST